MKKLTTNSKLIGCLMGLSIVALGTGCTDSDYDLSSVDSTIGVGGEGLELPTSSTENIILDDVLKLNNSDFVKIAANGDYMFNLKSATKPFNVLLACTRPLITELSDKLRLIHPLLPTTSPYPTMRLEAIRSIIPISCRRHPKSV